MIDFLVGHNGGAEDKAMAFESSYINESQQIYNAKFADRYASLGEMFSSNDSKVQRIAASTVKLLKNQENFIEKMKQTLGEATVVQNLGSLAPRVVDILRVAYPNSIGHAICSMQTMDTLSGQILIVKPTFGNTAAGVTAGQEVFKHQTDGNYGKNVYTDSVGTGDAMVTVFNKTLTFEPIRRGTIVIKVDGVAIGADNSDGVITGTGIDATASTIVYATGVMVLTFSVAPAAAAVITAEYAADIEIAEDNYLRMIDLGINNYVESSC